MKRFIFILISFTIFFFYPQSVFASTLFQDNFNGNGELSSYNYLYNKIIGGTLSVINDHVETTGFDSAYIYSGISQDNICASIDFNWTGGYLTGHWTDIRMHTTPTEYGLEFQIRNDDETHHRWVLNNASSYYKSGSIALDETKTHIMKGCVAGQKIIGYLDGVKLFEEDYPYATEIGYMGFASQYPTYYLDNFKIETLDDNATLQLDVPLIKQTDPVWKNNIYDSANKWSPSDTGIGSWGCALTSAAMVFQYHHITMMPDNSQLNPDTLNTWLKAQPDGYVGNGLINWLALSRLSKKTKSVNPLFTYDALEYKRFPGSNKTQLTSDLTNNLPDILEEPGHFIVATGINSSTFSINDPYYSRTSLNDYGNTFKNVGRFKPSHTDLSYILLYSDKDTTISMTDSNGNTVGESYIQDPIENANNPGQNNGQPISVFLLNKPDTNNYHITLTSSTPHTYSLKSYLYDADGEVVIDNTNGIVGSTGDSFTLQYNKTNNKQDTLTQAITYDSVINDIRELQANNQITQRIADILVSTINSAKYPQGKNPKGSSLAALGSFRGIINQQKEIGIDGNAYAVLAEDVKALTSSLTSQN